MAAFVTLFFLMVFYQLHPTSPSSSSCYFPISTTTSTTLISAAPNTTSSPLSSLSPEPALKLKLFSYLTTTPANPNTHCPQHHAHHNHHCPCQNQPLNPEALLSLTITSGNPNKRAPNTTLITTIAALARTNPSPPKLSSPSPLPPLTQEAPPLRPPSSPQSPPSTELTHQPRS